MGGAGETPTARIVAEAGAPLEVVDADGHRIEFHDHHFTITAEVAAGDGLTPQVR